MFKPDPHAFDIYTDPDFINAPLDFVCVTDMWEHSVKKYAELDAVATENEKISYGELDKQVSFFRTVLSDKGVNAGDRVGMYMINSIDFVKVYLAITTLGATAVLLPPHLDAQTVFGCSIMFSLSALVYDETTKSNTAFTAERNPKTVLISAQDTSEHSTASVMRDAKDPCTVIFTGGTTGKSKGSLLSNGAILRGTKNGVYGVKKVFNQRYILALPLTHVFGLIRNMLTSIFTGSTMFICANNKDLFRDVAMFRPTIIVLVPALAEMALQLSKKFGRNMLGDDMRTIICGAAFVPPYLIHEYNALGIDLLPGYGLTESANLVSGNPLALEKPDSVGIIYPDIEAKVVDGELWLKGPNMQDCYFGSPEENEIAYDDGYFKTGDLVRFDDDGFLYITGRKKEIIVLSNGENISPAELEAKFSEIDAIQDCLVFEGNRGTLELEVFLRMPVVMAKKIEDPQQYVRDEVAKINASFPSFMRVTNVIFRETDFVRSPSMKILRSKNGNVKN